MTLGVKGMRRTLKFYLKTRLFSAVIGNCPSKNFFQVSSSDFFKGYELRGAEVARYKLALCVKDGSP